MKKTFFILFFSITILINAQISFEKGYFINDENIKIECYIKNLDWNKAPDEIVYKRQIESDVKKISTSQIKEFQIYETEHYYKRVNVLVDKVRATGRDNSVRDLNYINSYELLKVLVLGKASLYELRPNSIFFYNVDNNKIEQLPYKKYVNDEMQMKENRVYQKLLFDNLKCTTLGLSDFLKLEYQRNNLVNLFIDYNQCNDAQYKVFNKNKTPWIYNLNLNFGIVNSSLETTYKVNQTNITDTFENQTNTVLGFELEAFLAFAKNKWSLFIAPNYQNFKSSSIGVNPLGVEFGNLSFEYSYAEIHIGFRHYMNLANNFKFFVGASAAPIIHLSSGENNGFTSNEGIIGPIEFESQGQQNMILAFGIGFRFKDKLGLNLNYYALKSINDNDGFSNNTNGSIALLATYSIF